MSLRVLKGFERVVVFDGDLVDVSGREYSLTDDTRVYPTESGGTTSTSKDGIGGYGPLMDGMNVGVDVGVFSGKGLVLKAWYVMD